MNKPIEKIKEELKMEKVNKEDIDKFKEELKEAINDIETLVFSLEGGGNLCPKPVSQILKLYDSISNDIQKAFNDLNKNAGDFEVYKQESATVNFVERRVMQ